MIIQVTITVTYNDRDGVSNYQPHDCLFNRLLNRRIIKAPRHWPLCGEFTGDWWIPCKCFHLMTSSWKLQRLRWGWGIRQQLFPHTTVDLNITKLLLVSTSRRYLLRNSGLTLIQLCVTVCGKALRIYDYIYHPFISTKLAQHKIVLYK